MANPYESAFQSENPYTSLFPPERSQPALLSHVRNLLRKYLPEGLREYGRRVAEPARQIPGDWSPAGYWSGPLTLWHGLQTAGEALGAPWSMAGEEVARLSGLPKRAQELVGETAGLIGPLLMGPGGPLGKMIPKVPKPILGKYVVRLSPKTQAALDTEAKLAAERDIFSRGLPPRTEPSVMGPPRKFVAPGPVSDPRLMEVFNFYGIPESRAKGFITDIERERPPAGEISKELTILSGEYPSVPITGRFAEAAGIMNRVKQMREWAQAAGLPQPKQQISRLLEQGKRLLTEQPRLEKATVPPKWGPEQSPFWQDRPTMTKEVQEGTPAVTEIQSDVRPWKQKFGHPEPVISPSPKVEVPKIGEVAQPGTILDPNVPPNVDFSVSLFDRMMRAAKKVRRLLPAEGRIVRKIPQSPVITDWDAFQNGAANELRKLLGSDVAKELKKIPEKDWLALDWKAFNIWKNGGFTAASREQAISAMPPPIQRMMRFRDQMLPIEQGARDSLGLGDIPEYAGPYIPRLVDRDSRQVVELYKAGSAMKQDLSQTVGAFQQSRIYDTMADGLKSKQFDYQDPLYAWAMREWLGIKLRKTAELMKKWNGTVLFTTEAEAKAAVPYSGAKPQAMRGLPGKSETLWARSQEEALFIEQNFVSPPRSPFHNLVHAANQLFRAPNLVNPLPHFLKNMLAKYGLSKGNYAMVWKDLIEFYNESNPQMLAQFKQFMPYSESSRLPIEEINKYIARSWFQPGLQTVAKLNRPSSKFIFQFADPGLRYSLFKKYVRKGMNPQIAANNVQLDLVRYSERSAAIDFWKAWPMNFFVNWRYGTGQTLLKQAMSFPVRTALFVGGVDYLREQRYRETGRWTHLPWDYVEAPISQAIENPKMIPSLVASFALVGPGGGYVLSNIRDLVNDVQGRGDWWRLKNMFWGLSQIYNVPQEWAKYEKTGDSEHLVNMLATIALGEHEALTYRPRRLLGMAIPETVIPKSRKVKQAEERQDYLEALRKRARERGYYRGP